ncbi:MAG TPA: YdcF family protein [Stellaceae bacterium]|nr:YdcF family protein [Stellaceae bacterium]
MALLLASGLGASAWFDRDLLLREAANLWIVSDPIGPADAAAVLGGGVADRPFAAARYYKEGLVRKILISDSYQGPAEKLGIVVPEAETDRKILLKLGVPANAIATFGHSLRNTHQEAQALRTWAEQMGVRSLIVPTEIFSARRVRWMLHRVFRPDTIIRVPALEPPDYNRSDWWEDNRGILAFQNEILKYLYYRVKY